jgi:hypothetical protein
MITHCIVNGSRITAYFHFLFAFGSGFSNEPTRHIVNRIAIQVKGIVRHNSYEQFFCMLAFPAVEDSSRSVLAEPNSRRKERAINKYAVMLTRLWGFNIEVSCLGLYVRSLSLGKDSQKNWTYKSPEDIYKMLLH